MPNHKVDLEKISTSKDKRSAQSLVCGDFDSLYLSSYKALCAYATRYVSVDEAEEIVQDTMLWLWDNWETIAPEKSVKALLFRIVHNKAVNCIKHNAVLSRVHQQIEQRLSEQFESPNFYLDKEPSKKWNNAGSIFMDYRNDKNLLNNPYTVIYGHNIRTRGTMFNRLTTMLSKENFERYRYVYIYTKEAALKYEIFSVFSCDASKGPTVSIPYAASDAFLSKILGIQQQSLFSRGDLTLTKQDHVITLNTCANSTTSTERVFVSGVLVGIGR